jgi:hypothetical protein
MNPLWTIGRIIFFTLGHALICVARCVVCPSVVHEVYHDIRQAQVDRGYRPNSAPPRSRIAKRRRALTLPLPDCTKCTKGRKTADQSSCPLLTKLPQELRSQVWHECLGNRTIHLLLFKTAKERHPHLRGVVCRARTFDKREEDCYDIDGPKGCWRITLDESDFPTQYLLPILLTCRQM